MSKRPQLTLVELDALFDELTIEPVAFSQCEIAAGWRMAFTAGQTTGLHYVTAGAGRLVCMGRPAVPFAAGALLITPPGVAYRIEPLVAESALLPVLDISLALADTTDAPINRWVAGEGVAEITMVCGHFRARQGAMVELFAALHGCVVQRFSEDAPGALMALLQRELADRRVGMRAMAKAMLRQLLVMLFREAIAMREPWLDGMLLVRDAQVMRAFQAMVLQPGAPHNIESLAQIACLSRSAFVKRFTAAFGHPPGAVLRELRLLRSAELLRQRVAPVEQIAKAVGYASASSFSRVFQARFGMDPSGYGRAQPAQ